MGHGPVGSKQTRIYSGAMACECSVSMTVPARLSRPDAGAPASYEVKGADPQGARELVLAVWREGGLDGHQAPEWSQGRYDWFYLRNPQGTARLSLLFNGEASLAGSLGIGCRGFYVGGERVLAGALVDFVVSPRHRSAFPALTLQRKGREHALESMDLLYGLPGASAVGVCKRLPSHLSLEFTRLARVLRHRSYLERLLPRLRLLAAPASFMIDALDFLRMRARLFSSRLRGEWVADFDESFDALWAELDKTHLCIGTRDRGFLRWRFRERPGCDYRIFTVRHRRDGSLRMYFVCRGTGGVLSIDDCLGVGSESQLEQGVLMFCLAARKLGASSVEVHLAGKTALLRALLRSHFSVRGGRPFFAVLGDALQGRVGGHNWYITRADEDT
jgi:hypothetical protein